MNISEEKSTSTLSPLKLDWCHPELLMPYVTGTGKILPKKYTGLSSRQQRHITRMIKRARNMLLMK
ncbi:MAG: 30S ribosomal protein S18 [Puniceicoccales bacterium]|jgi:small subunit ribosomal protein S18|nr:30S ribosomal protein S18 [Puniceicoccales bacterium]